MISSQKKFQPNRCFLRPPQFPLKKNCSDYGVHGIQIDRLGLMVSKQKSVLKNMYRVPRYYQKMSKIGLPNQTSKIWHILADILGLVGYFSKPLFALKPWVQAGWFEYHVRKTSPFEAEDEHYPPIQDKASSWGWNLAWWGWRIIRKIIHYKRIKGI